MTAEPLGAVIVGAGQAGLAASYHLKRLGIDHLLLERGNPGETWRTQRWDSFVLTTPSHIAGLPGAPLNPSSPDSFASAAALIEHFENYAETMDLPLRTDTPALAARRYAGNGLIEVETPDDRIIARNLVVASGSQNVPHIPDIARSCPPNVTSIHTAEYRNPSQIPAGNVLVVGSAKSGCQIVEELLETDRKIYLSTSRVGRVRRRLHGKDVSEWMQRIGYWSETVADLKDPALQLESQPLTTGINGGHTLSLQSLWRAGVNLLGRLESFEGTRAVFRHNLRENIEYGDRFSHYMTDRIEKVIEQLEPDAPPLGPDPADEVDNEALTIQSSTELDLASAGVTTIIWATGFSGDYGWVDIEDAIDGNGHPSHTCGISPAEGVYFVGMPWLRTRSSAIIYGADADGAAIAEHVASR